MRGWKPLRYNWQLSLEVLCLWILFKNKICASTEVSGGGGKESLNRVKVLASPCSYGTLRSESGVSLILTGRVEHVVHFDVYRGLFVPKEAQVSRNGIISERESDYERIGSSVEPSFALHVKVKRVIRGDRDLEGSVVVIGGLGRWACLPRLRLRDSRIFVLRKGNGGGLFLAAPPMILTLDNLKEVRRLTSLKDEPCAYKECGFGESCVVENGHGICRCPEKCSSTYSPICGSDEVSYVNECHLRRFACQHQAPIRIKRIGECDRRNPCAEKKCLYGSFCVERGQEAVCECPKLCSSNESSSSVCGSDGKIYGSRCELERYACTNRKNITLKYIGECNPCMGRVCGPTEVCQLDEERLPKCSCGGRCSPETNSVCGSDGKTYTSECEMKQEACRTKKNLHIIYRGSCTSGVNPCDLVFCQGFETCEINRLGVAECTCGMTCEPIIQLVCGTDGKTYDSECELKKASCRERKNVVVAYRTSCELCQNVQCKFGARCEAGICICPQYCPPTDDPVCASNQVVYKNECELQKASCLLDRALTVQFYGPCPHAFSDETNAHQPLNTTNFAQNLDKTGCSNGEPGCCGDWDSCPSHPNCECNKLGSSKRSCDLLTGTCYCLPGVTGERCDRCKSGYWGLHGNLVEKEGCKQCNCSKFGSVREDCEQMTGQCTCKPGVLGRKCDECLQGEILGPNGCTGRGLESLGKSCTDGSFSCSFGGKCTEDGNRAGCACNFNCDGTVYGRWNEVCASNGRMYESECLVRLESCKTQTLIWVVEKRVCEHRRMNGMNNLKPNWTGITGDAAGGERNDGPSRKLSLGVKSTRHLQGSKPTAITFEIRNYLGDSCLMSTECATPHSVCLNGRCRCSEGFHEDADIIQCKPIHSHISGPEACSLSPCLPPSACFDYYNGSYSCLCPIGNSNGQIGCTNQEADLPFFDGNSFIGLGKLPGVHKLSIEMEIVPAFNLAHGILLFASEHGDGTGDFVSLALVDGWVEFRYNLGDGPALLKSLNRIDAGRKYEIIAKRYNRDGLLRVNGEDVKGASPGSMKSLNLEKKAFLGFVPINSSKVWEVVGTSAGFIGCIQKLTVGRRVVDFRQGYDLLLHSFNRIRQCPRSSTHKFTAPLVLNFGKEEPVIQSLTYHSPCLSSPCQNKGECWPDNVHGFKCVCHPRFSGRFCKLKRKRVRESGITLDFRGFSYMELPKIRTGSREVIIELWVRPRSQDGLLLYSGQEPGKGDFICLILSGGSLSFLFNLGSGTANITWSERLRLHEWHWLVASRKGRHGSLQVDGGIPTIGKSPPALSELNLELPLYIGGVPDDHLLVRELGIPEPFDGAIQYVSVNSQTYAREIVNLLRERALQRYEGPPCGSSVSFPCHNGGSCFPRLDSFVCVCLPQFTGENCQIRKSSPGPVYFNGNTFLKFPRRSVKRIKVQRRNEFEILFKTKSTSSAVLIWIGKNVEGKKGRRGYLGLFLVDGYPELRLDLGSPKLRKTITLRSKVRINDGRWHQVLIVRRRRLVVFQVDGTTPQRATSPVGSNVLVSDGRVWIGGIGDTILPPEIPFGYDSGFQGCVDVFKMERRRLPISKVAQSKGFPPCSENEED